MQTGSLINSVYCWNQEGCVSVVQANYMNWKINERKKNWSLKLKIQIPNARTDLQMVQYLGLLGPFLKK